MTSPSPMARTRLGPRRNRVSAVADAHALSGTGQDRCGRQVANGSPLRTVARSNGLCLFTVDLGRGERLKEHRSVGPLALIGLDGEIEVSVSTARRSLGRGQLLLVPPGAEYGLKGVDQGSSVVAGVLYADPSRGKPSRALPASVLATRPVVDLLTLLAGASGRGVLWSFEQGAGININLARLDRGDEVGEHVNDAVDVALVGLVGKGLVTINGETRPLVADSLLIVPSGARRQLDAPDEPFGYLSIHAERHGLAVRPA